MFKNILNKLFSTNKTDKIPVIVEETESSIEIEKITEDDLNNINEISNSTEEKILENEEIVEEEVVFNKNEGTIENVIKVIEQNNYNEIKKTVEKDSANKLETQSLVEDLEEMLTGDADSIEIPKSKTETETFKNILSEHMDKEDNRYETKKIKDDIKKSIEENLGRNPEAFCVISLDGSELKVFLTEKGYTQKITDYLGLNQSKHHNECLEKGEPIGKTMSNPYSSMINFSADYKNTREWTVKDENLIKRGINKVLIKPIYKLETEQYIETGIETLAEEKIEDYILPDKEYLYASLFAYGATRGDIARHCNVAYDTVKKALQNVFKKYGKLDEKTFKKFFLETNKETPKYKESVELYNFWLITSNQKYNPNEFIYLKDKRSNKMMGKAIYLGNGTKSNNDIQVFKGTYMNAEIDVSKKWLDCPWIARERDSIISTKIVEKDETNRYVFLEDYVFSSPNLCTCVLLGYITTNAWQDWENVHGKKLKSLVDTFEVEEYENTSAEETIIEEFETTEVNDKDDLEIDDLKNYFETKKKKELIRKYNFTMINRFFEEVFETIVVSKITEENKERFLLCFEQMLSILTEKQKNILIDKYGLCDGIKKTYVEVARKFDFTVGGIKNSSVASIQKIKNSDELEEMKQYFELGKSVKENEEKLKADIDFIMSLME
ncbi:MAG: hypothetical protein PHR25_02185 [Clostridia bacterium]|nr:hypothetical protein [Clostridia bacterium]